MTEPSLLSAAKAYLAVEICETPELKDELTDEELPPELPQVMTEPLLFRAAKASSVEKS